jgi:hypothetical protein
MGTRYAIAAGKGLELNYAIPALNKYFAAFQAYTALEGEPTLLGKRARPCEGIKDYTLSCSITTGGFGNR